MILQNIFLTKYFSKYLGVLFNNACIWNYINDTILMILYRMFQSKCKRSNSFSTPCWHCKTENPFFLLSLFYTMTQYLCSSTIYCVCICIFQPFGNMIFQSIL